MRAIQCEPQVDPDGLHIVESLVADGVCASVRYDRETASTNSLAMNELQYGEFDLASLPKLYLTDRQTAGRGRLGRRWISDEATLTFSIVLSTTTFRDTSQLLSLATGVGVARAIEHHCAPFQAKLKWPNDVYLGGAKVAGILVEATQNATDARVIGIGINIGSSPEFSESAAAQPITHLAAVTGRPLSRYAFLDPVIRSVVDSIGDLTDHPDAILDDFRCRCLLTGQWIRLSIGTKELVGHCRGVTDKGELILQHDSGQQTIRSGEASLIRNYFKRH